MHQTLNLEASRNNKWQLDFEGAVDRLKGIAIHTPLQYNENLSRKFGCNLYLKREDAQVVRSYKVRGAYNMMRSLSQEQLDKGVVCASAGNHAQGFAYSCRRLKVKGVVFMPVFTSKQKVRQTKMFGEQYIETRLIGDSFDDSAQAAKAYCAEHGMVFVPAFDHPRIIEGQSTVGIEVLEDLDNIDYLFAPIGGGGLSAGIGAYFNLFSPHTKIVGLEPQGAPSMTLALGKGEPVMLETIDNFVDGASIKRVGDHTFPICKETLYKVQLIPEGKACTTILSLYNEDAIVVEPAGALSIAALPYFEEEIKGKTVVCVVSGGNNDIDRMPEIKERSLQFEGLKHYFLIRFAQRPGSLKDFINNVLGEGDDIARFEYMHKTNKENGPALVGIELSDSSSYEGLIQRMCDYKINFSYINKDDNLFGFLI